MIDVDFYDVQDQDRIVVPEKDLGSHWLCRVYYRDGGYVGKTKLLKRMFGDSRFGFVLKDQLERR